jgi:hypothetical protein
VFWEEKVTARRRPMLGEEEARAFVCGLLPASWKRGGRQAETRSGKRQSRAAGAAPARRARQEEAPGRRGMWLSCAGDHRAGASQEVTTSGSMGGSGSSGQREVGGGIRLLGKDRRRGWECKCARGCRWEP